MTYKELAEKAEMSSRYLKEIENGGRVPSFHKIRKLVRALNVPLNRFVPDYEVVALAEVFNVSCENLLGLTDAPAK